MKAFFDESGDDPREKVYVLAGWVATDQEWERFSAEWNGVLAAHSISYFKHNEAKGLKGEFAGKSGSESDKLLADLVEVICKYQLTGIICTFKHPLFERLLEGSRIPREQLKKMAYGGYTSPYYFCFHLVIPQLLTYLVEEAKVSEKVDFVFDDRSDALRPCIKLYNKIHDGIPEKLKKVAGTVSPGNDRNSAPLQAADLLAGQILANVRARAPEPTLKRLCGCRTILTCRIEPEDLSRFRAALMYMNIVWKSLQQ